MREIRLKGVSVVLKWRPVVEVVTQEKRTSAVLLPSWQRALFEQQVNSGASCYAVVQLDPLVPNVAVTTRPELLFPPKSPLRCSAEHIAKLPVVAFIYSTMPVRKKVLDYRKLLKECSIKVI